jgi:hypothetical protein
MIREMNMQNISKLALSAIAVIGLASGMMARADTLTFTLTDPIEYGPPGTTISFSATVTAPAANTGDVDLYGDTNNVTSPLTVDDSYYIANWPLDLTPGQSYSDVLFYVTIPLGTTPGTYLGSFTVEAGSGATPTIDVTDPFDVVVTPEPSSLLLLVTGLVGVMFVIRARRLTAS